MYCWVDGKVIKAGNLKVTPLDYGYLYGYQGIEIFRTYSGKAVFFQEQYNRLIEALANVDVPMPYTADKLESAIYEISNMEKADAIIHLFVVAKGNFFARRITPRVMILRCPLEERKELPVNANWIKRPKLIANIMGAFNGQKMFIPQEIYSKGIFYNENDLVMSGRYSTIFWVKNGILYTPIINEDEYCDIMRKWVKIVAITLRIPLKEVEVSREELLLADECFYTNTIEGVVPIERINGEQTRFAGVDGLIFRTIYNAYMGEVSRKLQGVLSCYKNIKSH